MLGFAHIEPFRVQSPMSPAWSPVRCREMKAADLDDVVDLLTVEDGFRTRETWARRVRRLTEHSQPSGFPKYGYLLDYRGKPVGTIFTIFSPFAGPDGAKTMRCYPGAWYVKSEFRNYAVMLAARALKYEDVTYFNITPNTIVIPLLKAQGYNRFCDGRFIAAPIFSCRSTDEADVQLASPDMHADVDMWTLEVELLREHAVFGCLSLTCTSRNVKFPFVFQPGKRLGAVPFVRLVYCRDLKDFIRFARPLGRFLFKRGFPLVSIDANGPIEGLVGQYSDRFPKYCKGPWQPRLGDLAYSPRVIFDF